MSINTTPTASSSVKDNIATILVCGWLGEERTYQVKGVRVIGETKTPINLSDNIVDAEQLVCHLSSINEVFYFPSDNYTDPCQPGDTKTRSRMKAKWIAEDKQSVTYALTNDTDPNATQVDFYTLVKY